MDGTYQAGELATGDLCFLAYAQHMAQTARSEPAKHLFESFLDQERRRLMADGAWPLRKTGALQPTAANRAPRSPTWPTTHGEDADV